MQYGTFVIAEIPRVQCEKPGIRQVAVAWSDPGSRFTAVFEALVIDWLREANVLAIARRLRLSWDQVAGIQKRAVVRGLARRESKPPTRIGVDETSFQKRHEYVTVVHAIGEYIEIFYNRIRRHSTIGDMSPAKFEKMAQVKEAWAA
jgi:transposase